MTSVIPCAPASWPGQPAQSLNALDECVLLHVSLAAQAKTPKLHASQTTGFTFRIEDLPEDVHLTLLNHHLGVKDLCSLAQVSRVHKQLAVRSCEIAQACYRPRRTTDAVTGRSRRTRDGKCYTSKPLRTSPM